ncbi:hypothetical protein PIROE2DRAFT_3082 [Piromyces sp. E2]|nr:hypothetical protein PIROE2DRAFT_3082 [Piromyces sp. E2]|eukprot:OUM69028.1 hypothetical protein PIROE2DRAFT_3082 [Piromyces sp. E2]
MSNEIDTEWDVYWADIHWIHENFDHVYLHDHQKINHFRNHYELTRKDLLVKNVKRMIKTDYALFQEEFKKNPGSIWIMKPVGRAQGKGIFLINKISQINQWKKDPRLTRSSSENQDQVETYIIQRYIDNPYLIGGNNN